MNELNFLSKKLINQILTYHSTPLYIYSYEKLVENFQQLKNFPNAFGLTVRYALKANPHKAFISIAHKNGIHFDASSEYEVMRCLKAGIPATNIQLTSQEFPKEFAQVIFNQGILFNACSLNQLELYGKLNPNSKVSFRLNPGYGSGSTRKTNVGGLSSAFGIWYEQIEEVKKIANKYQLQITRIHSHIGSGTDPAIWKQAAETTLKWTKEFPLVHTINLGGGFKLGRMPNEKTTNLQETGNYVREAFENFFQETKRKLKLEIEPGTYIAANTGSIICQVEDITSTGKDGYNFLKLNTGMDTITRYALYAARHPIIIINDSKIDEEYIVAGHCCESSDILTINQQEELTPCKLKKAKINDIVVIEYTGAYCASMSLKNYNSFPTPAEIMIKDNKFFVITDRQDFNSIVNREKNLN